ncbi:MAG TPA: tetratricopeptide repeat protein [Steroidobacteraceae bacterium]
MNSSSRYRWWKVWAVLAASAALSACAVPSPYAKPTPPPPQQPSETPPAETRPGEPPSTEPQPTPPPAPVIREPTLGAASRALVSQAQTQMATRNFDVAASSIERALRIEPDNPLLWIELGKVRFAEGNYVQAENMARKAVSMSVNAPRAQSSAWRLIADSYRARGKNMEAQEAQARADSLNNG